jgi:hypothetical protein
MQHCCLQHVPSDYINLLLHYMMASTLQCQPPQEDTSQRSVLSKQSSPVFEAMKLERNVLHTIKKP